MPEGEVGEQRIKNRPAPLNQREEEKGVWRTCRQDDFPLHLHLVRLPARHELNCLRNSGRLLILGSDRLEQNLGSFRTCEHDQVFPIGVWLEISCERRRPSSRSRVDRTGGGKESSGVASFLRMERNVSFFRVSLASLWRKKWTHGV